MTGTVLNRSLSVFLCHAPDDKFAVLKLHRRLETDGFAPWLDEKKLLPGHNRQYEITKAIHQSDVVIVCLSPQAINKAGDIHKEIKIALDVADKKPDGTIFLIPLKLEECDVPERLSCWECADLFSRNGYERLLRALRRSLFDAAIQSGDQGESGRERMETVQQSFSWQKWVFQKNELGWKEMEQHSLNGLTPAMRSIVEAELDRVQRESVLSGGQTEEEKEYERRLRQLVTASTRAKSAGGPP